MATFRRLFACSLAIGLTAALFAGLPAADAAVTLNTAQRNAAIAKLTAFPAAKSYRIQARGSSVTVSEWGARVKVQRALAHRSQVDPDFTRIDLDWQGLSGRRRLVGLIERVGGRTRLHYLGSRDNFAATMCRRSTPGSLVIHDLGLDPVEDGAYFVKSCRYDRRTGSFTRPMSAGEVAGLRDLYELKPYSVEYPDGGSESGMRSVARAAFSEVSQDCAWEPGTAPPGGPYGVVSRSDPRFGRLTLRCIVGSFDGVPGYGVTDLLVARAGRSGPFTRLIAHVIPTPYSIANACLNDRRPWGVPPRPRVELQFCTPFPSVLVDLNR